MVLQAACLVLILFSACNIWGYTEGIAYINAGHEAQSGEFPWQVSVLGRNSVGSEFRCGGVIISKNWILSTASCVKSLFEYPALILAGSLNLAKPGIVYESNRVISHGDHEDHRSRDVALIKTKHEIKFHLLASPITLAEAPISNYFSGEMAGWGAEHYKSTKKYTERLRVTNMNIISTDACRALLAMEDEKLGEGQFCATAIGAAACKGDEGGAFVTQNNVLSGLIDRHFCTLNDLPTVFIDVYYHRDWIRNITGI
ncbi:trypsin delta-like isoform X2 [Cloeon dipterum]|uniref:trypsin delta-like isoform X2 n=1 Tax=Cloeon dipterum TaxID=197152 RepID=UPI0032204DA8